MLYSNYDRLLLIYLKHSVLRVKLSLQYRAILIKDMHYPYFLMEVDFLNTYD